jgi:adenine-specific DNA-methyltransferase
MQLKQNSIHNLHLQKTVKQTQIDTLQENLKVLFQRTKTEHSEDTIKDFLKDFLVNSFYKNRFELAVNINRKDLVIYKHQVVEVIIEVKSLKNAAEMISLEKPNTKALQELLHYYLEERIIHNNLNIKTLIITNVFEWYIFKASDFEKLFVENQRFIKQYKEWYQGNLVNQKTSFFYDNLAKPFIAALATIDCTILDLREYEKAETTKLAELYKILAPENLLNIGITNDNNTLNKQFYTELLHIIGIYEKTVENKLVIDRLPINKRNEGSLLENTINILQTENSLQNIENLADFGETQEEQLFSLALELCIIWLNRILFLKLLESQLICYEEHTIPQNSTLKDTTIEKIRENFSFLNISKIRDFDELYELFFEVLAVLPENRRNSLQQKYEFVPYLNSSLFEITKIEKQSLRINQLKNLVDLPVFEATILKKEGKKQTENKNILHYIFEFLACYDFTSETINNVQTQSNTVINAAVLGLIFEKINGYKDGAFFTPSTITMYMCRHTLRKAVMQKFNYNYEWNCKNFTELYNKIDRQNISIFDANSLINSLKIIDTAVGSGHFLVSALNELLAIKSDLGILADKNSKLLSCYIEVQNDEIVITYKDNSPFQYNYKDKESQRIQATLFYEKQLLIENCLFGVDINAKSVSICRLRLWIELLKNAYYKNPEKDLKSLETLPNIDINIKCGNSLVSFFTIADKYTGLPQKLRQKIKTTTQNYKEQVFKYKTAVDKQTKQQAEKEINLLKTEFLAITNPNDADYLLLNDKKASRQRYAIQPIGIDTTQWQKEKELVEKEILELELAYNEKRTILYRNSFEWRFEFPEVLDENGNFEGFDVVIGNPPYITYHGRRRTQVSSFFKEHLRANYLSAKDLGKDGKFNAAMFFIEKCLQIGTKQAVCSLIIDISFYENFYSGIKKLLLQNTLVDEVINGLMAFENVGSGQVILSFQNQINENIEIKANKLALISKNNIKFYKKGIETEAILVEQAKLDNETNHYQFEISEEVYDTITAKIEEKSKLSNGLATYNTLENLFPKKLIRTGESVGVKEIGFAINEYPSNDNVPIYEYLEGSKSLSDRYEIPKPTRYFRFDIALLNERNEKYRQEAVAEHRNNPKTLGIGDQLAFENPKLLIRQSCSYLCATFTDKPYIYNRSFYSINNKNSSGSSDTNLLFILALLNSKVYNYYAITRRIIRMEAGKQPQIRLEDLKTLPIINLPIASQNQLALWAKDILALKLNDENCEIMSSKIDNFLFEFLELIEEEIQKVEILYK